MGIMEKNMETAIMVVIQRFGLKLRLFQTCRVRFFFLPSCLIWGIE